MSQLHATEILEAYEQLSRVTGRMREAAVQDDWDRVIALESDCSTLYAKITSAKEVGPVDREYQRRKSELIVKLLEDDAQIRDRLSGQLTRLWRMIDGRGRVAQVNAAYGGRATAQ
jgi:flagellar protein FliT